MQFKPRGFWILFLVLSLLCVLGRAFDSAWIDYISKPLLMPALMWYVWQHLRGNNTQRHRLAMILQISLPFAWAGDVLLMFIPIDKDLFFPMGLGSFLIMQFLYFYMFRQVDKPKVTGSLLMRKPLLALPPLALAFVVSLHIHVDPQTPPTMRAAVPIYAASIVLMTLAALNRYDRVSYKSFLWTFYGALLFLFSDLIIAINAFVYPFRFAGVIIMATYIPAQVFIVQGICRQIDEQSLREIRKENEKKELSRQSKRRKAD